MSQQSVDHYERLAIARDAGARQITRAFRRAARHAHPDMGGSPADFAALAEAYRVLSDAGLRAEYDRELDGAAADWDEADWGVEVGGDGLGGDFSDDAAVDDDGELEDGDPWQLDPFVGGPLRVPDPFSVGAEPDVPSIKPGFFESLAGGVALVLGLATVGLRVLSATNSASFGTTVGYDSSDDPISLLIGWVSYGSLAILMHAISTSRSGSRVVAWVLTAVVAVVSGPFLSDGPEMTPDKVSIAVGLCAFAAGVIWARAGQRRRSHPDRLAALWERDPRWLLDRHHRAVEWNRVRAALLKPRTTAVIVGPLATDQQGAPIPGRRWTFDPRTGTEAVRAIPWDAPQGSWLVLDDGGYVVASAPANAPEAWLGAMRAGQVRPAAPRRA